MTDMKNPHPETRMRVFSFFPEDPGALDDKAEKKQNGIDEHFQDDFSAPQPLGVQEMDRSGGHHHDERSQNIVADKGFS